MSTETAAPAAPTYRIRYSRTAVHLEGFAPRVTGGGTDRGGVVSTWSQSHCSGLTRSRTEVAVVVAAGGKVSEFADVQDAYDRALRVAKNHGGERICAKCTEAARLAGAQV
jgi:hypothetical protein